MIRTNLATRPFYNERGVNLALLAAALVAVAATIFNGTRVVQLSHSDTRLGTQAATDEARAAELRAAAARLRASVDPRKIEVTSAEARRANELIDRRTFSWTELFNRFETTLPDEARVTSVRPRLDPKRGSLLAITVLARGVNDVNQFMENLEQTGAFGELLSREEHFTDQGLLESSLETVYIPGAARPPAKAGGR